VPAVLKARLDKIAVFKVVNIALDELRGIVRLDPARALRQRGQALLDGRVQADGKHGSLSLENITHV